MIQNNKPKRPPAVVPVDDAPKQPAGMAARAESVAERYFFRRLDRLVPVRRFVIAWLLLFALLCACLVGQIRALDSQYRVLQPISGGVYSEGIVGDFTGANPLYASSDVDQTVSKLLFAGLFTYDTNNKLAGDLAAGYVVDPTERIYTVTLKPNLSWHDGKPLTARDVVFTYNTIKNPDALSNLNQSWRDIKVAAVNDATVSFTLPGPLSAFPHYMTNGIIPEHLLKDIAPAELRSAPYNTVRPIGSGPFMWQEIEVAGETPETREEQIAFAPFGRYHAGQPKLGNFVVHAYHDAGRMRQGFMDREVTAANFAELPAEAGDQVQSNDFMLTAANMVFFKQSFAPFADTNVRRALSQAVNTPEIIASLGYTTRGVRAPMLPGQVGYDKTLLQPGYDLAAASAALDRAGWMVGADGIRAKNGTRLTFTLQAQDSPEIKAVTAKLQNYWRKAGADVTIQLLNAGNLQRVVAAHEYEALLYGVSIGADPDVFVYWHSSQNDPRTNRLNFAEYKSRPADTALSAGRITTDPALRAVKYRPFMQAWQQDVPALGLYQPRYLYATHNDVYGLQPRTINTGVERLNTVHQWQIRQASVPAQR